MADGPSLLDQLNMRNAFGSGGGGGGAAAAKDPANDKDPIQHAIDASSKLPGTIAKLTGVPVNLTSLGEVSIFQPFESPEGFANKNIPSLVSSLNANGGVLAQIAHALIKNGVVTDSTGGVGGGEAVYTNSSGHYDAPITPAGSGGSRGGDVEIV